VRTVVLLISNLVMTLPWYGHLRFRQAPLRRIILGSGGTEVFGGKDAASSMAAGSFAFRS
jgi:uncharacterized protein (DUF486 family)